MVDTRRRLEDLPRSRLDSTLEFGRPGVHPESSVIGECGLAQDRILRCVGPGAGWWRRGDSNS